MYRTPILFLCSLHLLAGLQKGSAKRLLTFHQSRRAILTAGLPPTIRATEAHPINETYDQKLPPVQTARRFEMITQKDGISRKEFVKSIDGPHYCHPEEVLPMIPEDLEEDPPSYDPVYQKALTGELAEQIVTLILKKSVKTGSPVIEPVLLEPQLKALSTTRKNSILQRDGNCYKLSGELESFLTSLLLQHHERMKRSSDCYNFESSGFHVDGRSSVNLPVGLFGFQPPPLMNLP